MEMRWAIRVSPYSSTVDRGRVSRGQGQVEDRLVRRVHLLVGGRGGHLRGQLRRGLGDGRLDILAGGINVPAQSELQA